MKTLLIVGAALLAFYLLLVRPRSTQRTTSGVRVQGARDPLTALIDNIDDIIIAFQGSGGSGTTTVNRSTGQPSTTYAGAPSWIDDGGGMLPD